MLDGQASDPVPVLSAVPEGSVLGPVLFHIFIDDLPENIRSAVRLFADVCVLYRNIESPMDCQILQDYLNRLAQWETDWQMKFNVAEYHSMRVTRHPPCKHIQFDYTLHQQRLEQVQTAKYLGFTITDDLDWGQHISEISAKATKTLGFLRGNLAFAPRHTKEVVYKTLVRPKLEYAASIWHRIPIMNPRLDRWRSCRGQLPGGPAGDGGTPVVSAICLTNLSDHPWRPAGSSLP